MIEFKPCENKKGDELFDIESTKNKPRAFSYEYPFNLDFNIKKGVDKEKFKGPAIYVIEFNDEVIYIGKYRPEDKSLISTRWVRHIMTFTNRGYRVGGSALKKLVEGKFDDYTFQPKFEKDIKKYFPEIDKTYRNAKRFEDTGTVTSFNRLKFANSMVAKGKWLDKKNIDISNFNFNCFTLIGNKTNLSKRTELVSIIEKILLCIYKPKCNKEYNGEESKIKLADVQNDLEKSLNNLLNIIIE